MVYPAFADATKATNSVASKRAAVANSSVAARFKKYLGTPTTHAGSLVGANPKEQVTVVVRLTADSVANLRAARADHSITDAEKSSVHEHAKREQAAIVPYIESRGGKVMAQYSDALNGIKVSIARGELEGLQSLPGVAEVMPVAKYHLLNAESVPFIGAPLAWQGHPSLKGENIKIAVIDTGIDYTHANFGGPGTVAAFTAAAATSALPADPKLFGPKAPKVKGGIDLVGDDYDANTAGSVPKPDPNPLDCNGHGSHTSGTAAGFGVGSDGKTYHGALTSAVYQTEKFIIGPGVAPAADLYAVRVFGCAGSTNVVVDAIDWAVANDMDVISMSLGSDYGDQYTADALAVKNATLAGVLVAAASGNAGPAPYIASTPAAGQGGIGVAAMDSHKTFPGAAIGLNTGKSIEAIDANNAPLSGGLEIVVLRTATGDVSLGCDDSEYANVAGKMVVTVRGTCARVARAQMGQAHGAAAVVMINSSAGYPPYEGPIPDVTIPFLGVLPEDGATLVAAAKANKFAANTIANPTFATAASFSSGGPRFGDSALRPNVTAPGVSIFSTAVGTGNGGAFESGTSMATPHIAGVAALVKQAHPKWPMDSLRSAIIETADPGQLLDYAPRIEGSGLVQVEPATKTQAVVVNGGQPDGMPKGFFFGFEEFAKDFKSTREMTLWNYGKTKVDFKVTTTAVGGSPHTAKLSQSHITLEPYSNTAFQLTLSVPVAKVGASHGADGNDAFQEVAGYVKLTPTDSSNSGVALTVPYYLVPRARSNVYSTLPVLPTAKKPTQPLTLSNNGAITGNADFYALGLISAQQGLRFFDTRAIGVQSNLISATDSILVFAVNTFKHFSSADPAEFDVFIDTNGDGIADFLLASTDQGSFEGAGENSGVNITVLVDLTTGSAIEEFLVDAPTDGSTALLPVLASDMGVSPTSPRIAYTSQTSDLLDGTLSVMPGSGSFNVFTPSITNAVFVAVPKGKTVTVPVSIDASEWKRTPAKGLMIVTEDNFTGPGQAQLYQFPK